VDFDYMTTQTIFSQPVMLGLAHITKGSRIMVKRTSAIMVRGEYNEV
jgi:hypothetical protein